MSPRIACGNTELLKIYIVYRLSVVVVRRLFFTHSRLGSLFVKAGGFH
jgi:hypothetical protein